MHSDIMGVIQANTETTDTLAFALVLDLVWFLQLLNVCLFQWQGSAGTSVHIYGVGRIQRQERRHLATSTKHSISCDTRQHKLPIGLRGLSLHNYSICRKIFPIRN